ncbi:MAG: divalent-cation tolerance protein CutA [Planctomycetes bacterium]|nr:divalent-cation tolerance protein CutA [Planctomycetota bacterium]
MTGDTGVRVVLCTAPAEGEVARDLSHALVQAGLAACVNRVPGAHSVYRWEGKVCDDAETLLIIKTTADRLPALIDRLTELHPYEVPEIIAIPVTGGAARYLEWVRSERE